MQGYIIYHNATATGNITSEFIHSNNSLLLYQTEIPAECPGDWFEVSVAVVNTLGEGERVTSIVVADSIQPKFDGKLFITGMASSSYRYFSHSNSKKCIANHELLPIWDHN